MMPVIGWICFKTVVVWRYLCYLTVAVLCSQLSVEKEISILTKPPDKLELKKTQVDVGCKK